MSASSSDVDFELELGGPCNKRARVGGIDYQEQRSSRPDGPANLSEMLDWPLYVFHQLFRNNAFPGAADRRARLQGAFDIGMDSVTCSWVFAASAILNRLTTSIVLAGRWMICLQGCLIL